jgi:probable addiction module antidote protein
MAAYFGACLEEADGDATFIAKALGDIARARGMSQVARDAGLSRESLYKALSGERSPDFETILKVVGALGLELHAKVASAHLDASAAGVGRVSKPPVKAARAAARRASRGAAQASTAEGAAQPKARRQRVSSR